MRRGAPCARRGGGGRRRPRPRRRPSRRSAGRGGPPGLERSRPEAGRREPSAVLRAGPAVLAVGDRAGEARVSVGRHGACRGRAMAGGGGWYCDDAWEQFMPRGGARGWQ